MLGPVLRHVGETDATVWLETDAACEAEILCRRERTFTISGHHYALVVLDRLEPGTETPYEVALDGERVWPPAGDPFPPCAVRTRRPDAPVRLLFGSCRAAAPHDAPFTLSPDADERGREIDALWAYARRLAAGREEWPDLVLQLGDQVYVDEAAPDTRAFIRGRRDTSRPPGEQVLDFEEYAHLYRESWSDPPIRWLMSTVATATIWDDHDVHDDWNTSLAWVEEMRERPWWSERIRAAIASYWIYQHLGNLSPEALEDDELYPRVRAAADATDLLFDFAGEADREAAGKRWSYSRTLGGTRLVVVDSRGGRLLGERREMVDDAEWGWIEERASEPCDHLVLATSLPFLLPRGADGLQRWNERICAGAWGELAARLGERLRQALDLEHWAAFGESFGKLELLLGDVAAGRCGTAPASVVVLSGDVHYSYLAAVEGTVGAPVYQVTCSPLRNPLTRNLRAAGRLVASRAGAAVGVGLQRLARVGDPAFRWRLTDGPWFDNAVGTLELDGRRARLRIEKTVRDDPGAEPRLEVVLERRLA